MRINNKQPLALLLIVLLLCLWIAPSVFVEAGEREKIEYELDLNEELEHYGQVRELFSSFDAKEETTEIPPELIKPYIPEGAWCTDCCMIGVVGYIDYQLDGVRYIVAYYPDNVVEKTVRALGSNMIYTVSSEKGDVSVQDVRDNHYVIIDDGEIVEVDKKGEEKSVSAVKTVDPYPYTSDPSTAPYTAKLVMSGLVHISALSGTAYSPIQEFKIYETMAYHSEVKRTVDFFAATTSLVSIASLRYAQLATVKGWLDAFGVVYTVYNILQESCNIIDEHAYTFLGGKECGIYDPTQYHTFVETYAAWDDGRITISWSFGPSGYKEPSWGHTKRSTALDTLSASIRDSGKTIYNDNILIYGYWIHGVGNGFGY